MSSDDVDFSFDGRVALSYDEVRAHPPEVSRAVAAVIADEVGPNARILEPGVGTGRIALPLVAAGCQVVGADISPSMLTALAEKPQQGSGRLDLIRCDISKLPLVAGSFDAIVCVHVLHLIANWEDLLRQLVALLKPGGIIILGRDWIDPASFAGQIRNEFRRAVVELSETIVSPPSARGFVAALIELGMQTEADGAERTAAEWQTALAPSQVLDEIRSKNDAESWVLPDELLGRVMERLDDLAAKTWPDTDGARPVKRRFVYSLLRAPKLNNPS